MVFEEENKVTFVQMLSSMCTCNNGRRRRAKDSSCVGVKSTFLLSLYIVWPCIYIHLVRVMNLATLRHNCVLDPPAAAAELLVIPLTAFLSR